MAFSFLKSLVTFYNGLRRKRTARKPRLRDRDCLSPDPVPIVATYIETSDRDRPSPDSAPIVATYIKKSDRDPLRGTSSDHVLRPSASFVTDRDDPSIIEPSAKRASVSAPELDTSKSHPSRSTSGSESLDHDDDRRRSVGSGPIEPFPHLYEEPCSISGPSQLQMPPLHGPRRSFNSARENLYGQEEDRDRVIPKIILCYLKVIFDGRKLSKKKPFHLDWQDDGSYQIFDNAAQKCVQASPETINKQVWRTDGVCKLFKQDQEWSSKALENEDQWSEVLHLIIAEFVSTAGNEYAKFHLEITWTYAVVEETASGARYCQKIADRIDGRMKTNWRKKKFIPQKDFHAIMSQSVIEHLIDKDESLKALAKPEGPNEPVYDQKQFIRDVASSHKHLLALCVHEDLPLICLWQMIKRREGPATLPLGDSDKPPAAEKRKFDNILIKQWYFTAYQFPKPTDATVHCIALRDEDVLPIEACDEVKPIGEGTSKMVYKVRIRPGHHCFTADKTRVFALKEFKNGCPFEDFERESKVLRKLLDVPHKHITPHYASWSQTEHFFMLSPLASCNLKTYWKNTRPRLGDADFVLWELRQLRGLADGLRHIYNLGGWHHDLKGENVLVFDEGDCKGPTLKIADFGSAKIHARRSGPRDGSNPTKNYYQGTSAYEAPDWVIRGETSRPYDVWTLGCIFLEMLIWTFGSHYSEFEKFSEARRTLRGGRIGSDTMFWYVAFENNYYTTHWKPAVRNKLQKLESDCNSDKGRVVFRELVLTTSKMLRMDPSTRPKAHEVHNDMDRMTLWVEEDIKQADGKIQNLPIGAISSTNKSETSGEFDGDGVPVKARLGHLMMDQVEHLEAPFRPVLGATQQSLGDGVDLKFMGSNERLDLGRSGFQVVGGEVDRTRVSNLPTAETVDQRPLYGSHLISPDRDAYGEARTAVASAVASDFHLFPQPSPPQFSIPYKRRDGFTVEAVGSPKRRSSF